MGAKLNRDNAPHSQPDSMVRLAGQCLLLLFIGALPALLTTIPAKAGACDNQAVSTSVRDQQLSAAVVINEVQTSPYGERHEGSVCWSLDLIKAAGQPDKIVVHADVDIPDLAMKVAMDFSQNTDRSVSASHFVAMTFEQPPNVAGGEVVDGAGHHAEVLRAGARHAVCRSGNEDFQRFISGRPVGPGKRSPAQSAAFEGAVLVRYPDGLRQSAPRHPRGRKRVSWRADVP